MTENISVNMSELLIEHTTPIPGLGRPFKLGSLYDCRIERLIPGITLWDKETLEKKCIWDINSSVVRVSATDDFTQKAALFNIDPNSRISILSGLIDVSGAATFLNERNTKIGRQQVTLKYQNMSHVAELTMEHFTEGRVEHPEVFTNGTATHVVTGIHYGVSAFFSFTKSSGQERQVLELVKRIPLGIIDMEGELKMSNEENELAGSLSFQFYGDFSLKGDPSTFQDAVMIYNNLPTLLANNKVYIPLVIKLFPLCLFDIRAEKLKQVISFPLVECIEKLLEELFDVDDKCNCLLTMCVKAKLPLSFRNEIKTFQNDVSKHASSLTTQLKALLPDVRSGERGETDLWKILSNGEFSNERLWKWLEEKEEEINTTCGALRPQYESPNEGAIPSPVGQKWGSQSYIQSVLQDATNSVASRKKCFPIRPFMQVDDKQDKERTQPKFEDISGGILGTQSYIQSAQKFKNASRQFGSSLMHPNMENVKRVPNIERPGLVQSYPNHKGQTTPEYVQIEFQESSMPRVGRSLGSSSMNANMEDVKRIPNVDRPGFVQANTDYNGAPATDHAQEFRGRPREGRIWGSPSRLPIIDRLQWQHPVPMDVTERENFPLENNHPFSEQRYFEGSLDEKQIFSQECTQVEENYRIQFPLAGSHTNIRSNVTANQEGIQKLNPSKPQVLKYEPSHDSISVTLGHPLQENIAYEVSYLLKGAEDKTIVPAEDDETSWKIQGLSPDSEYDIQIRGVSSMGRGPFSDKFHVKTLPCEPPLEPLLECEPLVGLKVSWQRPFCIGQNVTLKEYIIKVFCSSEEDELAVEAEAKVSHEESSKVFRVKPNRKYKASISASCGKSGCSLVSQTSEVHFEVNSKEIPKIKIVQSCQPNLPNTTNQSVYQIPMTVSLQNEEKRIRKCISGKNDISIPEKVILVVGATGAGKTTLINGLVNYLYGVEWADPYRFKLISESSESKKANQAKSQTSWITSYTIQHQPGFMVPFSLTVIDTPGFGDTDGIMRDKEITGQIKDFFTTQGPNGIDHLDAVGFVAQSSLARLSVAQKYIFDHVLSLFGRDISHNIFMLLTFADGQKPQVLSGLKAANIKYEAYFKFNNSALYIPSHDAEDDFDQMFWALGEKSFEYFFHALMKAKQTSLVLTKQVLDEREALTISVDGIMKDIHLGLSKLETLKTEIDVVKFHEADIAANKNFKYTVKEEKVQKEEIPRGQNITNCVECNRTCHEVCAIPADEDKAGCAAMSNGECQVCPKRCHWTKHKNFPFKWVFETKDVEKQSNELYAKYQEAGKKKISAVTLIGKLFGEFEAVQGQVIDLTHKITASLQRLNEIALKPDPLSTSEYVDMLIENEKSNAMPGWSERVQQLKDVKVKVEYVQALVKSGKAYNPFVRYKDVIEWLKQNDDKSSLGNRFGQGLKRIFQFFSSSKS